MQDIRKTYRMGDIAVPVLKGVSLTDRPGGVGGPDGDLRIGQRRTLMHILGCLDRPDAGRYTDWMAKSMSQLSADQRAMVRNCKLGFVFQSFNLLPRTSALDNVAMPLTYTAGHLSERDACGRRADRDVGARGTAANVMDHEPSQLSGGQQQRVAIARALINRPSVAVCRRTHGQPRFPDQRGSALICSRRSIADERHHHHHGDP